jgi:hypothetical protein
MLVDELEKNPNSTGYIVINWQSKKSNQFNFERLGGFFYEDIISLQIKRRNFNRTRLKVIRSDGNKFKIDFLLNSNNLAKPNFVETKWDLSISSKPKLFDKGESAQLCEETFLRLNTFSEFLAANPNTYGHFVIYAESSKDFPKEKQRITKEILKAGIPVNRTKFFFIENNLTISPYAEVWLVPKNKK